MQRNGKITTIGLIGGIVITFTVIAFFLLDIERNVLNRWALVFLLLSEVVLFAGLIGLHFSKEYHKNLFFRVGLSSALLLYFILTLLCVLLVGLFSENLNIFILAHITIIASSAIIAVSIFAWSRHIASKNEIDITKVGTNVPKRGGF
ncbi:MAG: hypothetical protein FWC13_13555 [Oscillospiraceae bacterium]|nr:hypothetical protein [Oscillospiraceae bacterium]